MSAESVPVLIVGGGPTGLYAVRDGAVLVRPDGHVAWRTASCPDDPETELGSALRSVLALP